LAGTGCLAQTSIVPLAAGLAWAEFAAADADLQ